MRRTAFALLAVLALLLSACAEPLPKDKLAYAGEWRGQGVWLLITADGRCEYQRQKEGMSSSIEAPIKGFEGDNFVVGVGFLTTTFVVSKPPQLIDGKWKMTVDGVELTRASGPGENSA